MLIIKNYPSFIIYLLSIVRQSRIYVKLISVLVSGRSVYVSELYFLISGNYVIISI